MVREGRFHDLDAIEQRLVGSDGTQAGLVEVR